MSVAASVYYTLALCQDSAYCFVYIILLMMYSYYCLTFQVRKLKFRELIFESEEGRNTEVED